MDKETRLFITTLKKQGNSITKPRLRLFKLLQSHAPLTISNLIKRLHRHDQATVYRNVTLFERLGIINRLRLGWHSKLELSDIFHHHHHHLTCTNCGKIIALKENKAIEMEIVLLSRRQKFQAMDHQLEIRGLCPACQS